MRGISFSAAFDIATIYVRQHRPATAPRQLPPRDRYGNTVYIIFRHVRQFIVDHVRQFFYQTTRRNIRRHQRANIAGFKIGQRAGTCALRFITVDRRAANTVFIKLFRQMVRAMLGAGEDQRTRGCWPIICMTTVRAYVFIDKEFTCCVTCSEPCCGAPLRFPAGCATATFRQRALMSSESVAENSRF